MIIIGDCSIASAQRQGNDGAGFSIGSPGLKGKSRYPQKIGAPLHQEST